MLLVAVAVQQILAVAVAVAVLAVVEVDVAAEELTVRLAGADFGVLVLDGVVELA